MSRGVKDLRELICVSRLTTRDSDEDDELSFSDDDGRLSRALVELGLHHEESSDLSPRESPDSGFCTGSNGVSPEGQKISSPVKGQDADIIIKPTPPASRKKNNRKKYQRSSAPQSNGIGSYDLPKPKPLPPVSATSQPSTAPGEMKRKQTGNYDTMLEYCDQQCVYEWLREANVYKDGLTSWCQHEDNFVCFSHFWLNDFNTKQRLDMFQIEYAIILEHLEEAFINGRRPGYLSRGDIEGLFDVVFKEFQSSLVADTNNYLFLDYLDVLSSTHRHEAYKRLLSNVRVNTRNREYAQTVLAFRAFVLLSLWSSVVNFYRTIHPEKASIKSLPTGYTSVSARRNKRAFQSVRLGYIKVLEYMLTGRDVPVNITNEQQHSLLFTAIMNDRLQIVQYLLKEFRLDIDVNATADNGNTALHASANSGNIECTKALLQSPNIQVNCTNPQCDDITPLHLAVMHGHTEVVRLLLDKGADDSLMMGDLSVVDVAKDFDRKEILKLLPSL